VLAALSLIFCAVLLVSVHSFSSPMGYLSPDYDAVSTIPLITHEELFEDLYYGLHRAGRR